MNNFSFERRKQYIENYKLQYPEPIHDLLDGYFLARIILKDFFGLEWIDKNILEMNNLTDYFKINSLNNDADLITNVLRVINLAELLFNLQYITGFNSQSKLIREGQTEPTIANLAVGKLLFINSINFRFVQAMGEKGNDYDLEVSLSEKIKICIEAKLKLVTTKLSQSTIEGTLNKARGQVPKDKPGIIFLSVPFNWMADTENGKILDETTNNFLRNTGRISSVVYYCEELLGTPETGEYNLFGINEIVNQKSRFLEIFNGPLFELELFGNNYSNWISLMDIWGI